MPATAILGSVGWRVVRMDIYGTRFEVGRYASKEEAERIVEDFESGYPHHQTYFAERVESAPTPT